MTVPKKPPSALNKAFASRASENNGPTTWVDAFISNGAKWKRRIFKAEEIQRIETADEKNPGESQLCLYDDTSIRVLMDAAALWQKIFVPDFRSGGEPISLLSVTGATAFPAPQPPATPAIGNMVEGEGVYVGRYELEYLGKVFNVFAAPKDFSVNESYHTVLDSLSSLSQLYGYAGKSIKNRDALIKEIADGSYNGEWIIPPLDVVRGRGEMKGLYGCRSMPGLLGSFETTRYMALSEKENLDYRGVNVFSGVEGSLDPRYTDDRACRLVRLVEVPKP